MARCFHFRLFRVEMIFYADVAQHEIATIFTNMRKITSNSTSHANIIMRTFYRRQDYSVLLRSEMLIPLPHPFTVP